MDKQELINNNLVLSKCSSFIPGDKIFVYLPKESYQNIFQELQFIQFIMLSTQFCDLVVRSYLCNYIYPACDGNETIPVEICKEECVKYILRENPCATELEFLADLRTDLRFERQCNTTFPHIEDVGVFVNASSTCVNVSGEYMLYRHIQHFAM